MTAPPEALKRCAGPECTNDVPWREGMKPSEYERVETCGHVCGIRLGHRRRATWVEPEPHRCKLAECDEVVPTIVGETGARYRKREYHSDECRRIGKGRTVSAGHRARAPWLDEVRLCRRAGCEETFSPKKEDQAYHDHACSVLARTRGRQRETKLCECGCAQWFERPAGLSAAEWQTRRFADPEHYSRWRKGRYFPPANPSPAATGQPGASRAGRRTAPKIAGAKPPRIGGNAWITQDRHVFADGPRTEPFRPGRIPVREPAPPVTSRPSFGLSRARRSA